jgi:nucleolysin TIA-1/TIAR
MADTGPAPTASQLPPPPQPNAGAPGYENGQNGQSNPAHMPPPPLHIPQNTNPIPTAVTSPMSGLDPAILSPSSGGGFARRAAPEPNKRALYVGGLDQRVTEDVLRQIFETTGHVQNVKIIPDKNVGGLPQPAGVRRTPQDIGIPRLLYGWPGILRVKGDQITNRCVLG